MSPEQMRERAAILAKRADIKAQISLIKSNLAHAPAEWTRKGYDADAIERCKCDAGRRLQELGRELRAARLNKPRKPRADA